MAVTQAFFDPTESYVGGSVFINTLGAFTNRRFAMNQQLLEQRLKLMDPVALNKAMASLQTQIDRQKKGLVTDYEIIEKAADDTRRFAISAETTERSLINKATSRERAAGRELRRTEEKITKALGKAFADDQIAEVAKEIDRNLGRGTEFADVTTAEQLQTALSTRFGSNAAGKKESVETAISSLYSTTTDGSDRITDFIGIPGLERVGVGEYTNAFVKLHGLDLTTPSATATLKKKNTDELDMLREEAKGEAERIYTTKAGTGGGYVDTSIEAARKKAEEIRRPQKIAAEAHNEQIQAQIDQLEKQKLDLASQLEKALSGDTADLYGGFRELGISNLALHSPFIQEQAVQRRMAPERSVDIDVDIAGMMPDVQLPKPQMPDVQLPKPQMPDVQLPKLQMPEWLKRKREDDEDEKEKRQKREKSMDPLFSRTKRKNPIDQYADDDPDYLDAVTPPDLKNKRVEAIENMKLMDPKWFSDLTQEELANLFIVPLSALLDQEHNFKKEFRDRNFTLNRGGGKPILRSNEDDDIVDLLQGPTLLEEPEISRTADSDFDKFKDSNRGSTQWLPEDHPLLAKGYSTKDTISYTTALDGSKVYKINLSNIFGANDYRYLEEEDIKSWDDFPTREDIK